MLLMISLCMALDIKTEPGPASEQWPVLLNATTKYLSDPAGALAVSAATD